MANLTCKADTCTYNTAFLCSRGDIVVGGKHADSSDSTCCESFRENKGEHLLASTNHPSTTISIDCEAKNCRYNRNFKCTAEEVTINGAGAKGRVETACKTFVEK